MWNLLTRTSQSFEFVNLKLTIIWISGFIVRYCVLLPGRMLILFVGVSLLFLILCRITDLHILSRIQKLSYLMVMSFALSLIPGFLSFLKLPIYNWAAKTCFRILSRSFSGVIQFHNKQHRPKSDGICVANHTTPIDVVVLSCDRSYALVGRAAPLPCRVRARARFSCGI